MSEFKIGDRVITRWDDSLLGARALARDTVPEGEHVIIEISGGDARLDEPDGYWYPLKFMERIDDAPAVKDCGGPAFLLHVAWDDPLNFTERIKDDPLSELKECSMIDFRDECAMRAMEADWSSNGVANPAFVPETTDESLEKWAALYYRMADAMMKARKK